MTKPPPQQLLAALTAHFCDVLELSWRLPKDIETAALQILDPTWEKNLLPPTLRRAGLVALINSKFRVNATPLADFLAAAAERKQPLHYHDKQEVQTCFDTCDSERLRRLLARNKYDLSLLNFVRPVAPEDTLRLLRQRLHGEPGITESALRSLFGGYFFIRSHLGTCTTHSILIAGSYTAPIFLATSKISTPTHCIVTVRYPF